ncbi:methyltransferase, TIGR00027 family [Streptomyces zhaozhouensis]|uniref:S-adenosyl-L-methionine-dependent methyltransferase n=1 Tax=Streptomyces zhaozhouensis TaxID=1300267 RepID=A0A286E0A6_9ACTN|nr:SAM-dependent methyltransferase [Streptomyces zhaozhouensis]SOD64315.1 methyltransferase, TIGR00027 family [Streptomyces zhaozhouensis]
MAEAKPPAAAHGVARTALLVAAARAIETHRADALAADPYAEHFVHAEPTCADWPLRPERVAGGEADPLWGRLGRYFGLRTRVVDDFLLGAARAGVRQVVLLGAGLDTRAHRLPWPAGRTVYELDRRPVLAFKARVHAALPPSAPAPDERARRVAVPVDLAGPWESALTDAGFDPGRPTAWLAEGLLLYLPEAAERRLVDTVDRLSAPGSAFFYEIKRPEPPEVRADAMYTRAVRDAGVDLLALFAPGPRPDSVADLVARGWSATAHSPFTFARRHGRGPREIPHDPLAANRWVLAHRSRSESRGPSAAGRPAAPG